MSWLIRKRHPSRAFISSRCVTLSSTSPQRAASSSSAAPPPRRSALFPALSRSFPSALFPAAFLLHAPRSARRLSCLHSCGGSPKRTRQYARWYRREAYLLWNKGADDSYLWEQFRHSEGEVSSSQPGTHRGRPFRARSQCQQPEEDNDGVVSACQFLQYCLHALKGQTVLTSQQAPPPRARPISSC